MKTTMADERGVLLSVVLPIAETHRSSFCEKAWLEDEPASDNGKAHDDLYVKSDEQENSVCTEEEKVAVEQLTELRRIRDLSNQEEADDCSCSTESSNTYGQSRVAPSATSSQPALSTGSPAVSTTAACIVNIENLKPMQEQQKRVTQMQPKRGDLEENLESQGALACGPSTCSPYVEPDDDDVDGDDQRRKPRRSRLLVEIYQDLESIEPQATKANKRRRKAMSRIMAVDGDIDDDDHVQAKESQLIQKFL